LRRDFFLHPAYAQQQAPHRRWQWAEDRRRYLCRRKQERRERCLVSQPRKAEW